MNPAPGERWTLVGYKSTMYGASKVSIRISPPRLSVAKRALVLHSDDHDHDPFIWRYDRHGDLSLCRASSHFGGCVRSTFIEADKWSLIPLTQKTIPVMLDLPFLIDEDRVEMVRLLTWYETVTTWVQWATDARLMSVLRVDLPPDADLDDPSIPRHRIPAMFSERDVRHEVVTESEVPREQWTARQTADYFKYKVKPVVRSVSHEVRTEPTIVALTTLDKYQRYSAVRLYSQQLVAIHAVVKCKRLPLWYDMRVGKTDSALTAAKYALRHSLCKRIYVVCPNMNTFDPWLRTCERYDLRVAILDGNAEDDRATLDDESIEVIIVNYERVVSRIELTDMDGAFLICDETSAVKNPQAKRTKALMVITDRAEFVVPLNGTPLEQGPTDFWSQMRLVDPWGLMWGSTYKTYERQWLAINRAGKTVARDMDEFQRHISETSLRCIRSEADQFSGQDKFNRYIALKPTEEIIERSKKAADGVTESFEGGAQDNMSANILACMTHMQQIVSGYWKTQDGPGLPFLTTPLKLDPKLVWLRAQLTCTSEPYVIFCKYNEQEYNIKALCRELGVTYASTQDAGHWVTRHRIRERMPAGLAKKILPYRVYEIVGVSLSDDNRFAMMSDYEYMAQFLKHIPNDQDVIMPPYLRYDSGMIHQLKLWGYSEYLVDYKDIDFNKYDGLRRSQEIESFQKGEVRCFILKCEQGRGITLNRLPAIQQGGEKPGIIMASPTWSLGTWEQDMDRCVGVDPVTGKNLCTPIYMLSVAGSIDDKILKALRGKKDVQSTLLADVDRKGFASFANDLIDGMSAAMNGDYFDAQDIMDKMVFGIPPSARMTQKTLVRAAADRFGVAQKDVAEHINNMDGTPYQSILEAWLRLLQGVR